MDKQSNEYVGKYFSFERNIIFKQRIPSDKERIFPAADRIFYGTSQRFV